MKKFVIELIIFLYLVILIELLLYCLVNRVWILLVFFECVSLRYLKFRLLFVIFLVILVLSIFLFIRYCKDGIFFFIIFW